MTCTDTLTPHVIAAASRRGYGHRALSRAFSAIVETAQTWQRRRQGRAQLRSMPEYLLRDVGLDIATARREEEKPFWRS